MRDAAAPGPAVREERSFCRLCPGACGMRVSVGEDGRIVDIKADREHALTAGYACYKGLHAHEFHYSADRLLHSVKRGEDGALAPIGLDRALDEVAERLRAIIDTHGPGAVACFVGTAGYMNSTAYAMAPLWMRAIGSPSMFSSLTIDQSAKLVTAGRLGSWEAGRQGIDDADVWMFVGANPLVSLSSSSGLPPYNGQTRLKQAKHRGMKLIVVDPRVTETAQMADIHLQPYPGQDAILMAGILRVILANKWHDVDFCDRHVNGLDALEKAVEPFTLDRTAQRTGVPAESIRAAAELWAGGPRRGCAGTGTGACMSPASNLADHMVELLNVVCGRFLRAGEPIRNPGVTERRTSKRAQVTPPPRWWEKGHRSRIRDVGTFPSMFSMEMAAGIMADEMLTPGEGRIRALIVVGGNPALAVPDQAKMVAGMQSLDLMVSIDPFPSATARLSHYVFAPTMMYERADFPMLYGYSRRTPVPFLQYTPAITSPPPGSEVVDDWYVLWSLAKRLGVAIEFCGETLDMETPPEAEALLRLLVRNGSVSFDALRDQPGGSLQTVEPQFVEPGDPNSRARFDLMPDDVAADLAAQAAMLDQPAVAEQGLGSFLLTSRRMRDALNSLHVQSPSLAARIPRNPLFLNPSDLAELGLSDGDWVSITSDTGRIRAQARSDPKVRPGVVQMSHCFGGLPGDAEDAQPGACTNLLVSTDRDCEAVNAMPRQSGIPVIVERLEAA